MKKTNVIYKFLNKFKDALFPENFTCIYCNDELNKDMRYSLCESCLDNIKFITDRACVKCGALVYADTTVCSDCKVVERVVDVNYSATQYNEIMRKLIHDLKYSDNKYLYKPLGMILNDKFQDVYKEYKPDLIIPVPLNKSREKLRGYNQTELILSMVDGVQDLVNDTILIRVKDTPFQASLPKDKRKENVKGAFQLVNSDIIKGKNVLIVDDIYTTGSTIDEIATIMKKAKARSVRSITLANAHIEDSIKANKSTKK